jgi:hypothetical protein
VPPSLLAKDLEKLYSENVCPCDINFIVGNERISAHRAILCCRSLFFQTLLGYVRISYNSLSDL